MSESIKNFFLIQSVSFEDYFSLRKLALKYPLMNLPAEEILLKQKMAVSEDSFSQILPKEKRNFFFVLKTKTGEVLGSSQVAAKSGTGEIPSYSLKIFEEEGQKFLQLKTITDGPSYLGGLILDEKYRACPEKAGKQLSLIRFLFAALQPEFFEDTFHAEVAPFLDEEGKNPFFESFFKQHISLSMKEIDYLTLTDKEKLFSSYPSGKVLFSSLPKTVQTSLGKPGLFSQRAAALLEKQNFQVVEEVDPFDGGPYMQAKVCNIPVIQKAKKVFLHSKEDFSLEREKTFRVPAPAGMTKEKGRTKENSIQSNTETEKIIRQSKKWLWGKMEKAQFTGGVLEGFLHEDQLFIPKEYFSYFPLMKGERIFISPFE